MSKDSDKIDLIQVLYGFIFGVMFMLIIYYITGVIQ